MARKSLSRSTAQALGPIVVPLVTKVALPLAIESLRRGGKFDTDRFYTEAKESLAKGFEKSRPELDMLASVDLFQGLTRKELDAVHAMSREQSFPAGAVVAAEGAAAGRFYLIVEGKATVTVGELNRALATLGPGGYFGEIALIDGEPRSATVTADTPLRTLSIASFNFKAILFEYPAIGRKILLEMCRRVRRLDQSLVH